MIPQKNYSEGRQSQRLKSTEKYVRAHLCSDSLGALEVPLVRENFTAQPRPT